MMPTNNSPTTNTTPKHSTTWFHTPSNLTLLWLLISLPLVIWDTAYVLLRPHSMTGGHLHSPIWTPYTLYATVDYMYGFPAYHARNGFTAAQASLNAIETVFYLWYIYTLWQYGERRDDVQGTGSLDVKTVGWWGGSRVLKGRKGARACLVMLCVCVMTFGKTVLYGLNEYFSDFANIGHNSMQRIIFLWIIPNGAWIIVPIYLTYVYFNEALDGLEVAATSQVNRIKAE